jgi:hypothetical protein
MIVIPIMAVDLLIYIALFYVGLAVMFLGFVRVPFGIAYSLDSVVYVLTQFDYYPLFIVLENPFAYFIIFFAGFGPSIWMWLYVAALLVNRALLRSERIVNWLRWGLDVEKNPFRSTGAIAAALAFVASVAILLISAEIFRITLAS